MTLTLDNVTYSYRTKYQTVNAVKEVSCAFESGAFHALVGRSGSGKTTLLSLMAGLERPNSGEIIIDGEPLVKADIDKLRRESISVIYQNFNLFPLLTVQENVMYPLLLKKTPKKEAERQAGTMLDRVGLDSGYFRRLPAMLSGGEQQRVAITRALATGAGIILADEPTGNLDGENARNIVELLKGLAHEDGRCVIVVTHDSGIAAEADAVYQMDSGVLSKIKGWDG